MVLDSKLPEHLSHFGIDMMTMEKASFVSLLIFILFSCALIDHCKLVGRQISSRFLMLCIGSSSCGQKY